MKTPVKVLLCLLGLGLLTAVGAALASRENTSQKTVFAMDSAVTVRLTGKADPKEFTDEILKLDKILDCHNEDSEISRLNRERSGVFSETAADILSKAKKLCLEYPSCDITAGELISLWGINTDSPRRPEQEEIASALENRDINGLEINGRQISLSSGSIDLGCCAKGYACDVIKQMLLESDVSNAVVTFGSSSLLFGEKPNGELFTVDIRDPFNKADTIGYLALGECFLSTSGGYERYAEIDGERLSHIFDLDTGCPSETDLVSVTVVGYSGILTDMASTAVYIDGSQGLNDHFSSCGKDIIGIVAVDDNKNVYLTDGLKDSFYLNNEKYRLANCKALN